MINPEQRPNCFTHQFSQWSIQISFSKDIIPTIQIYLEPKSNDNVYYRGTINEMDFRLNYKDSNQDFTEDIYRYLQEERTKNIKIFSFKQQEKRLKIANRKDQILICVNLEKYGKNMKQADDNVEKFRNNKSVRISKPLRGSIKFPKSQSLEQKILSKKENKNLTGQDEPALENLDYFDIEDEQQLDYFQSFDSQQNSDQQLQNIIGVQPNSNRQYQENQQPKQQQNELLERKQRMKQVDSQWLNEEQSQAMINQKFNQYKTQQLMIENMELKKQRIKLLERIVLLENQNKQLKLNNTVTQSRNKEKAIERTFQISQNFSTPQLMNTQDQYVYLQPKQQKLNHTIKPETDNENKNIFSKQMRDDQAQQFLNTKKPQNESQFYQYFDPLNKVFEMQYQMFTFKLFQQNFFPYNWSNVRRLNLDGNLLGSQGFNKLLNYYFPQLNQISAGYNNIKEVQEIQKLENIQWIDLRANPLNEKTKIKLQKIADEKKIQILF